MPAGVGGKRSFFEDSPSTSPSSSKRLRRSWISDVDRLAERFPVMTRQQIERALAECDGKVNLAINHLHSFGEYLGLDSYNSDVHMESNDLLNSQGMAERGNGAIVHVNPSAPVTIPKYSNEWAEFLVTEMSSPSSSDNARTRISRILEAFGTSVAARAGQETIQTFHEEQVRLQQQLEAAQRENQVLKRGVFIQHERQKQYEDTDRELQHLKQLISQSHEKIRTLEARNYTLTMHLKQYEQNRCVPGHLHPDLF